jgi:hypothetical protein
VLSEVCISSIASKEGGIRTGILKGGVPLSWGAYEGAGPL